MDGESFKNITTDASNMGVIEEFRHKNVPLQIDVGLTIEKEMTNALTGKTRKPEKMVQRINNKFSIATQEGSKEVDTLFHYQCAHCEENFISSSRFKAHCLKVHEITNPYKCTECDNAYTNESAMRVHVRTHKNHKPYVCEECGRSFAQCSTWMAHVVRHSGATPHICDTCGKAFATKGDLATHSRIHKTDKPFSCEACGLSFPRKSNYTRHMRTHTGEKPYSCNYCSKSFARSENCKEHERLHTKERPFTCELCGMSFGDSGNFSKHKKIHSKKITKKNSEERLTLKLENIISSAASSENVLSDTQIDTNQMNENKEKSAKKTRRKYKRQKKNVEIESSLVSSSVETLTTLAVPQAPTLVSNEHALTTISLVRQPIVFDKPLSVAFSNIIIPISEADKSASINESCGLIKINADDLASAEVPRVLTDPSFHQNDKTLHSETLIHDTEALKLPNYQFPLFLPSQPVPNSIMNDLNYSTNSVNNQTFMMLDYNRDSTFSFANDTGLMLQENFFSRSPTVNLTGTDSFIYNTNLVSHEFNTTSDQSVCDMRTDFGISSSTTASIFPPSTAYDDDLETQPLDTNKFLNEQYLVKNTKKSIEDTEKDS